MKYKNSLKDIYHCTHLGTHHPYTFTNLLYGLNKNFYILAGFWWDSSLCAGSMRSAISLQGAISQDHEPQVSFSQGQTGVSKRRAAKNKRVRLCGRGAFSLISFPGATLSVVTCGEHAINTVTGTW